jgi:flagella basal body P-ring formation protein FlgA
MKRKDCESTSQANATDTLRLAAGAVKRLAAITAIVAVFASSDALGASIRVWPSAVVVDDAVRLADVCELSGFDVETERKLQEVVVAKAPPAGGSRLIHIDLVRQAVTAAGANMATVTLGGATQCAVTRPSALTTSAASKAPNHDGPAVRNNVGVAEPAGTAEAREDEYLTLRQAVIDYFNVEFVRYGGTAEVIFDRTSNQILDLSGPQYEFNVRRRGGSPLGLTPLEVDVLADGRTVQTVPLVVQVTMLRHALAARRSINQGATIGAADVHLVTMSFTRLDKLGLDDAASAIGQRAKRFMPAGTLLEPSMLEQVPLVLRGQLVRLMSVSGSVRVVTTAKADEDGLLGEIIKVRAVDNKRVEFDAAVVGPGQVQIGAARRESRAMHLAMGDNR